MAAAPLQSFTEGQLKKKLIKYTVPTHKSKQKKANVIAAVLDRCRL